MPDLDHIRAILARIPNPLAVLERLFAFAPVGFQIYEASGKSLVVNQAFLDLFGSEPPPDYNVLKDEIAARNRPTAAPSLPPPFSDKPRPVRPCGLPRAI